MRRCGKCGCHSWDLKSCPLGKCDPDCPTECWREHMPELYRSVVNQVLLNGVNEQFKDLVNLATTGTDYQTADVSNRKAALYGIFIQCRAVLDVIEVLFNECK